MSMLVELDGTRYQVSLAPVERPGRLASARPVRAVCFERTDGRWVGRALIDHHVDLAALTQTELRALLRRAVREG